MPKITKEEDFEEEDESTIDEELEELEEAEELPKRPLGRPGFKPIKTPGANAPKVPNSLLPNARGSYNRNPQQGTPTTRYSGFARPQVEGIVDVETNEVVATTSWDAFANILERLERIENTIGQLLEK